MFRGEMKDMAVTGITQKGPALRPFLSVWGAKGTWHQRATKRQTSRLQWVFKLSITQS